MAEPSRKQTLIAELETNRTRIAASMVEVRHDMDFGARLKSKYKRHPAVWFGAAAVVGVVLARIFKSRRKDAPVRYHQAEKPAKVAFLFTALKLALPFAKPALTAFLAKKNQSKTETP